MIKLQASDAPNKAKINYLFSNDMVAASLSHMKLVAFSFFKEGLSLIKDENLRANLRNLCCLLGLTFLQDCSVAGYDSGYFKRGD